MSYRVYIHDFLPIFQKAHYQLWKDRNTNSLDLKDQVKDWKNKYHAKLAGGYYSNERSSLIYVDFNNEAAFFLFLLEWS